MIERSTRDRILDGERELPRRGRVGVPSRETEQQGTLAVELEPWRWTLLLEVLYRVGDEADDREDVPESVATDLFVTHALLSKQLGSARNRR